MLGPSRRIVRAHQLWHCVLMHRTVTAHLDIDVQDAAEISFMVAVAHDASETAGSFTVEETLSLIHEGSPLTPTELMDAHGTRMHHVEVPVGRLTLDYQASVAGKAPEESVSQADLIRYLRPSRYCQSDVLLPTAISEFQGLSGLELITAVRSWVSALLSYVPGSGGPTDGAVDTLLSRQGVCRDYAHLVVALLRGVDVPARLAAVYAPGLSPMDFHAVAEAYFDGAWHLVDATTLAPRQSMLRVATGRDAADTAFMSTWGGYVLLNSITVTAVADALPIDDVSALVQLA